MRIVCVVSIINSIINYNGRVTGEQLPVPYNGSVRFDAHTGPGAFNAVNTLTFPRGGKRPSGRRKNDTFGRKTVREMRSRSP